MSDLLSRRDLFRVSGLMAVGLTTPKWLSSVAHADIFGAANGVAPKDSVLVVCQFSGGNDGLNTVVPFKDDVYYQLRPTLGIARDKVLDIGEQVGLHPSLAGLADLYKQGKVSIVQNVGYPQPNRSHFKSMEIWQSGGPSCPKYGWIGRHFDQQALTGPLNPVVALGLSTERPRALDGKGASIPCFASLVDIQNMVGDPDAERMLRQIQGADAPAGSPLRVVQQANKAALDAMAELNKKLAGFAPKETYANDAFGNGFKQIAQLIATSPATRVVYFSAGGFDTHARQADTHANLLSQFSNAVAAFQKEIEAMGKADKVAVLVFSEFGRRSYENASSGTDHGAAAPVFMIGKNVKGGLEGPLPNLGDLNDGDLKHAIDFRQIYASALENWIGGDSTAVLGEKFQAVNVFRK
ncbi:MAG: DUF1501 domain-containing protein [Armatimonadetes bacterium]|nr:DUF1501 domain-containing protein [Armatimonadota bacterium]